MFRKLKYTDVPILLILVSFMLISTAMIYSATLGTNFQGLHMNNVITYGILFIPMVGLSLIDYRILVHYLSYILYGVGLLLLVVVIFKGMDINGSRRWINLGVMAFQPSEVMKLFVIMALAKWLKSRDGQQLSLFRDLLPLTIIVGIPFLIVLQQPDLGTSIVFLCIFAGMLWIGNIQWKHVLTAILAALLVISGITLLYFYNIDLFSKIVKPHQLHRIQTFLDPTSDPQHSWHVVNSIKAIATGQMTGEGFLHGTLVRGGFIPYDYADSIFVVIGEEFGFIGSSVLLLLYFLLIYQMIQIAIQTKDLEGKYIIIGIVSMFTLQIFENIAMHTGLMPLTGIALPFISYGGSSLLTNMMSMGLVLSVKQHQNEPLLPI